MFDNLTGASSTPWSLSWTMLLARLTSLTLPGSINLILIGLSTSLQTRCLVSERFCIMSPLTVEVFRARPQGSLLRWVRQIQQWQPLLCWQGGRRGVCCSLPQHLQVAGGGDSHHECLRRETKPREIHPRRTERRHEGDSGYHTLGRHQDHSRLQALHTRQGCRGRSQVHSFSSQRIQTRRGILRS